MTTLPDKLSALIRLAIKDLELCEQTPGVVISMGYWYAKKETTCYVCLAGAVMMQTLQLPLDFKGGPDCTHFDFSKSPYQSHLGALNQIRMGRVSDALSFLPPAAEAFPGDWSNVDIPSYAEDPGRFKADLLALASALALEGL